MDFQQHVKIVTIPARAGNPHCFLFITTFISLMGHMPPFPQTVIYATTEITTILQTHVLPATQTITITQPTLIICRPSFQPIVKPAIQKLPGLLLRSTTTTSIFQFTAENTGANGIIASIVIQQPVITPFSHVPIVTNIILQK